MENYLDMLKNLPEEVQEKAKACKTKEEFLDLLKSGEVELPDGAGFDEIGDEELAKLAGGCSDCCGNSGKEEI